jgi:hypothetical protein
VAADEARRSCTRQVPFCVISTVNERLARTASVRFARTGDHYDFVMVAHVVALACVMMIKKEKHARNFLFSGIPNDKFLLAHARYTMVGGNIVAMVLLVRDRRIKGQ